MPRRVLIPAYQLHRGSGQAKVRIDGRDHYLGKYDSPESREAYDQLIRRIRADKLRDEVARKLELSSTLAVAELISAYLSHCVGYYRKLGEVTSEFGNIGRALDPVLDKHGAELAVSFGPRKLEAIRDAWIAAGITRRSVNRMVERVRRAWKWAASKELIPESAFASLRTLEGIRAGRTAAVEAEPVRPVSPDVVEATLRHLSPTVQAMVRLQMLTGMRPGEACVMRTCDLNTSGKVWEYRPHHHKTEHHGRERVVMIGPRAQEVLRPWLRPATEEYLFRPTDAESARLEALRKARKTPVQPSQADRSKEAPKHQPGERYTTASLAWAIRRACDRAWPHPGRPVREPGENLHDFGRRRTAWDEAHKEDLATWRSEHAWAPNRLRHLAATEIRREFGLDVARTVLGHSSPAVTLQYAEADQQKAADAMGKVG